VPGLFVLLAGAALAQEPRSIVRGQVVDARTGGPIAGATVVLEPSDPLIGAATDSAGRFTLADVPVGFHTLKATHVGYEPMHVPELWLRAGKETVLRVELAPAAHSLGTFSVTAMAREEPEAPGVRTFTVEQGLRYPAMFQDPARLMAGTPGVSAPNDQANHLVVRGNSPNANAWLLEGAEIVSPNHLGNAGTPTDLPTLSGGGVNILSAQMLGPSRLRTGVSPVMYGNALGGLMDMELRRGNSQQREWTAQAGLLGLDLSTEGPIGKGGKAFHLVNYRYSTLGVLSAMGVDLGGEAIGFQDLSFHAGTRLGERGELRVFGMGGMSGNVFEAGRDTAEWGSDKDSKDITFTSSMGAAGATVLLPLGARSTLRGTVVWSASFQDREETVYDGALRPLWWSYSRLYERKLSAVARVEGAIGRRLRYGYGVSAMDRLVENLSGDTVGGWLLRPFAQLRWDLTENLQVTAGMAFSHFTYNGSEVPEPRGGLRWRTAKGRTIAASCGVRGQLPWSQLIGLSASAQGLPDNRDLGMVRSEDAVLGYEHPVNERLSLRAEAYHQRITGVPVPWSGFAAPMGPHLLNTWDEPAPLPMEPTGTGTNNGVELSLVRSFVNGTFYQLNGTVFEGRFARAGGGASDSRWNTGWMANAMAGREFRKAKEDRVRTWGVSARLFAMGGQRTTPMDVRESGGGLTAVVTGEAWSERLADVFRLDLRVYLKKDREGRTGQWALDLQNATNRRNEVYRYLDQRQGRLVTATQLGLIPNLSYRIEF